MLALFLQGYYYRIPIKPFLYFFPPIVMNKAITRFLSSFSILALTAASVSPAFAYRTDRFLLPDSSERVEDSDAVPAIGPFNKDPGSGFRTNRRRTSRAIRANRNINRPRAGHIRVYGGERGTAEADRSGRVRLPVRNTWRHPGLRNRNRHIQGNARKGYRNARILRYKQGDLRRRPRGLRGSTRIPRRLQQNNEAGLPPRLTTTGRDGSHPNYRRLARGNRNLNDYNRPDYAI